MTVCLLAALALTNPTATAPLTLTHASPELARSGDVVRWPDVPLRPESPLYEATIGLAGGSVVHYQSPGCGETVDLATGAAALGCGRALGRKAFDGHVELALDTWRPGEGLEHTLVRLGRERLTACLAVPCTGAGLTIDAPAGGHLVAIDASGPVALETHQVLVALDRGKARLRTSRRGGGPYRDDAIVRLGVEGRAAVANGRLRSWSDGEVWSAEVLDQGRANEGTSVELDLVDAGASWVEVDGRFRRAGRPEVQARLDAVAPDPTRIDEQGLGTLLRGIVEDTIKTTVRWLQPRGRLVPVGRRDEPLAPGVRLVTMGFRRHGSAGSPLEALPSELEVVGVVADPAYVTGDLESPCRDDDGLAAINGYAFRRIEGGALLPEAGLVVDGRVHGPLRVDSWWANLVVDRTGRVSVENARDFYERRGLDASVAHVLQGTLYVKGGRSVRREGDNPEVNWRSAAGIGRGGEIILAHTLVPTRGAAALTAYGRGLTQAEMADVLVALGANDAIVLDGGPSAALSLDGRLVSGGLRGLPLCFTLRSTTADAVAARAVQGGSSTSSLR